MLRVCVFCGSSPGRDPRYAAAAAALARELVSRGIGIVFGGGSVGLMGVLADQALAGGGSVVGVIPHALAARELAHRGVADMRVVATMHERKALMAELSDGFVALPGGTGTFEELFESHDLEPARDPPQADRHPERGRLLRPAGGAPRPRGDRGLRLRVEPGRPVRGRRADSPSRPHGGAPASADPVVDHSGRSLTAQRWAAVASAAGSGAGCAGAETRVRARASGGSRRGGTTTGPASGGMRRIGIV